MNIPDKKYIHMHHFVTMLTIQLYLRDWEVYIPMSDATNTGCTVHDAYVRNRVSWTCIQSPWSYVRSWFQLYQVTSQSTSTNNNIPDDVLSILNYHSCSINILQISGTLLLIHLIKTFLCPTSRHLISEIIFVTRVSIYKTIS